MYGSQYVLNFARLLKQLEQDEGFRPKPYQDTVGVWTIGFGATHIGGHPVTELTPPVTRAQARHVLMGHAYQAAMHTQQIVPNFDEIDPVRQEVLVNMCFNMGRTGLLRFRRMLSAVAQRDWTATRAEMMDSRWYKQVGQRGWRLCEAMRRGSW